MDTKEKLKQKILGMFKSAAVWYTLYWDKLAVAGLLLCLVCGTGWYRFRWISSEEMQIRQTLVQTAESWLGCQEADGSHKKIVDFYNSYEPRARDYQVTYEDNWCAAFGSAAALKAGFQQSIPMECSCEQQILLFDAQGNWQEDECYLPRPGDYIYYVWDEWRRGDCTAWANHVGIVAETFGPVIKVIEGNKDNAVDYRYIFLNDITIRGFGLPDYAELLKSE